MSLFLILLTKLDINNVKNYIFFEKIKNKNNFFIIFEKKKVLFYSAFLFCFSNIIFDHKLFFYNLKKKKYFPIQYLYFFYSKNTHTKKLC